MKLCECGCDRLAPIATKTNSKFGHKKGQPVRFISGHHSRLMKGTFQERFERFFEKTLDGCWVWKGSKYNKMGYGLFYVKNGLPKPAHRVSYELYKSAVPKGLYICHSCDNPPCVNPNHLWAGSHTANMQDMAHKNRSTRGEKNWNTKLTADNIRAIRKDPRLHREIAKDYGVATVTITHIKLRNRWGHID